MSQIDPEARNGSITISLHFKNIPNGKITMYVKLNHRQFEIIHQLRAIYLQLTDYERFCLMGKWNYILNVFDL